MNYLKVFIAIMLCSALVVSCKPASRDMTPEDFLKIENEILSTDLTPESKEAVTKKYNYTLKQFEDFAQKVETDPALKAKVGEIRLQKMEGIQK